MRFYFLLILLFLTIFSFSFPQQDTIFKQAISVKYLLPESLKDARLTKVVTDYNDNVYVLTSKGVFRVHEKTLIKDLRYTPLAQKIPVDITLQEGTRHLFYLYDDKWLTNGYAGVPYKNLPKGMYNQFAVAADGTILLVGTNAISFCKN